MSMLATIVAKSDQLNADDLIGRTLTIRVKSVAINPASDQPVAISYEGDNGKPFKPSKSMRRVLIQAWGPDANAYAGRSMTLYRDEAVKWGGMEVGGIRISHMSDIPRALTMALTEKKGSKKPFTVQPLKVSEPAPQKPAVNLAEQAAAKVEAISARLATASPEEAMEIIAEPATAKLRAWLEANDVALLDKLEAAIQRVGTSQQDA